MDTSQLDAWADDLGRNAAVALERADLATRRAGLSAVADAQSNAPVDTGFHRGGIGMDLLGTAHVEVGASSTYGPYLEDGTWKMEARPHINPAVDRQMTGWVSALETIAGDL